MVFGLGSHYSSVQIPVRVLLFFCVGMLIQCQFLCLCLKIVVEGREASKIDDTRTLRSRGFGAETPLVRRLVRSVSFSSHRVP